VEIKTRAANAKRKNATSLEIAKTDQSRATPKVVRRRRVDIEAAVVRVDLSPVNPTGLEALIAEVATRSRLEASSTTVTTSITPRTPADVVAGTRGTVAEVETEIMIVTGTETEKVADAAERTSSPIVWPPILTSRTRIRRSQLRKVEQ